VIIRELQNSKEVRRCVEMYFSLNDWLELDFGVCLKNMNRLVRRKRFFRLLEHDSKIIAWIYCEPAQPLHQSFPQYQQIYYASDQSGILAYKAVVKLHEAMLDEAVRLNYRLAVSQGSHMDEANVFSKILEKNGWERRGYGALKRLPLSP
jgi:hypothetical protein